MASALIDAAVRLRVLFTRLLVRLGFREDSFFLVLAIFVGVVTAVAAVIFHELIVKTRELLFGAPGQAYLYGRGMYLLVLVPVAGGLVVGVLSKIVFRVKGIHGLVDVMESVIRSRGFVSPTVAIEKILTSGLTIGTGGSVGAEAPIVQIGAAIASAFGRMLGLSRQHMPVLIGCGAAAGISAIFNSPIGGVLFALEVILQDFSIRALTPVVIASVIAHATTQSFMGMLHLHYTAIFGMPFMAINQQVDISWAQIPNFLILGIACGIVGVSFTRLMIYLEHKFTHLKIPGYLKPSIGGLVLGIFGIVYILGFSHMMAGQTKPIPFETYPMPAFYSDGYGAMQPMLTPEFYTHWHTGFLIAFLLVLLFIKLVCACFTVTSGGGGGVIGPALFLGAVLGGLLGVFYRLAGGHAVSPEVYALVGMGAVLAAVIHAPMASLLILLELTQDYKLTVPAMMAIVSAVGVAQLIFRDTIYSLVLRERGINVGETVDLLMLRRMNVEQMTLEPAVTLDANESLGDIFEHIETSGVSDFVVINAEGHYVGMLVAEDVLSAMRYQEASPLLIVGDLARTDIPLLRSNDDLAVAMDRFAAFNVEHLPVSTGTASQHVIGMLSRRQLMRRFRQEVSHNP